MKRIAVLLVALCLTTGCADYVTRVATHASRQTWRSPTDDGSNLPPSDNAIGALERIAAALGVNVVFAPTLTEEQGALGMFVPAQRQISIDAGLSSVLRMQTLAHELAHVIQPPHLNHSESEVFAETVAAVVSRRFGVNTLPSSSRYLADHHMALRVAREYHADILWAANVLAGQ